MALELKGEVKVGPSGGLKKDAINAAEEIARQAKEEAQAIAVVQNEAPKGSLLYKAKGYPAFNCSTAKRKRVKFASGMFILEKEDADFEDIKATLDYHVGTGDLTVEVL